MALDPAKVRFVARPDRRGWGIRAAVALLMTALLLPLAAVSIDAGAWIATASAAAGIAGFGAAASRALARCLSRHPPLKLDAAGLEVGDVDSRGWRVAWAGIAAVRVERVLLRRRVVLVVNEGRETPVFRALPVECHADLPPEWLAGLIETFRKRGGPFRNL